MFKNFLDIPKENIESEVKIRHCSCLLVLGFQFFDVSVYLFAQVEKSKNFISIFSLICIDESNNKQNNIPSQGWIPPISIIH